MATGVSRSLLEVLAGQRRARRLPTFLIAAVVTLLIAVPLSVRAADSDDAYDGPTPAIVITVEDRIRALDGARLEGPTVIEVIGDEVMAIAWQLFPVGETDVVAAGQDLDAPFLVTRATGPALRTSDLADGAYELFVTATLPGGEERLAAAFSLRR